MAAEIALVTVRRSRIAAARRGRAQGRPRGCVRLISRPGRFLAVIQIGITFVAFLASAFARREQRRGAAQTFFASIPIWRRGQAAWP